MVISNRGLAVAAGFKLGMRWKREFRATIKRKCKRTEHPKYRGKHAEHEENRGIRSPRNVRTRIAHAHTARSRGMWSAHERSNEETSDPLHVMIRFAFLTKKTP
jgi:hypothetical protein